MPRDGNGNFTRTNGVFNGSQVWTNQADSPDKVIDPGRHDTHDDDLAQGLTDSLPRDGQAGMTGDLPMGNRKITSLLAGTEGTDATNKTQVENYTATGGTVSRSREDRAADFPNVKDFGADPSAPAATNDAAFAAAEAAGRLPVLVPHGTYALTNAPTWKNFYGWGFAQIGASAIPFGDIINDFDAFIPTPFATLAEAWDYLLTKTIKAGAIARVRFSDGTYTFSDRFPLNHPNGERIQFYGNQTTPANCILRWTNAGATDGLVVDQGHSLGFIDGFTIDLPARAVWPNNGSAVLADTNGTIIGGSNMIVTNWFYGAQSRHGGHVRANNWTVNLAGDVGLFAILNGSMSALSSSVDGASYPEAGLGSGIVGEYGGAVDCGGSSAVNFDYRGVAKFNDGVLRTEGGTVTGEEKRIVLTDNIITTRSGGAVADIPLLPEVAGGFIQLGAAFTATPVAVEGYTRIKLVDGSVMRVLGAVEP